MFKKLVGLLIIVGVLPLANASDLPSAKKPYLQGTVTKVEKHESPQMSTGSNPSDTPLPDPETYAYDVSVHANCGTYVGRYETWYDYLPSVLRANQSIELRLTRGAMYVEVPNQKELQMRILSRHEERGQCNDGKSQVIAGR